MWRRIVALLCITCQYRAACAGSHFTEELAKHFFNEEDMEKFGIDPEEFADWLKNPTAVRDGFKKMLERFSTHLSSDDDAGTCDMCSGASGASGNPWEFSGAAGEARDGGSARRCR